MPDEFSYDVFLSHNNADKPHVRRLAERLREAGLRVWFDEWTIRPGDDIYLAIERGLETSRTLVLCLSAAALKSDWVSLERGTALFRDPTNLHRRFVPVLLAECKLPDTLRRYKCVDCRQDSAAAFAELLAVCRPETDVQCSNSDANSEYRGRIARRRWLLAGAVMLVLASLIAWPRFETWRALKILADAGLTWNPVKAEITIAGDTTPPLRRIDQLQLVSRAVQKLRPRSLELPVSSEVESLEGFHVVNTLTNLSLLYGNALTNLDFLGHLDNLQSLSLGNSSALGNMEPLRRLTALRGLSLFGCSALTNIDGLRPLTSLRFLNLEGCEGLQNLDALKDSTLLERLDCRICRALTNLAGIGHLSALKQLDLYHCDGLTDFTPLHGLSALEDLNLDSCKQLRSGQALEGLTNLVRLNLEDCSGLPKDSWPRLRAALPKTRIQFPDGSISPP